MRLVLTSCLIAFPIVTLLTAEDTSWKDKPIPGWDVRDARQVLDDSPWVKNVTLEQVRNLSKFERRDGGDWEAGIGPSVGLAGTGLFGPYYEALALARAHVRPDLGTVAVRWESARPVRAAETKVGELDIPMWQGDYYAIAVYDIPPLRRRWNEANELKQVAFLKRDKKKDLKPARVLVVHHESGLATIVYLFSRSNEITKKDRNIRFDAQIGRLFVSQLFFPEDMQLRGEPEL